MLLYLCRYLLCRKFLCLYFLCRYTCVATFYVANFCVAIFTSLFFMLLYLCHYFYVAIFYAAIFVSLFFMSQIFRRCRYNYTLMCYKRRRRICLRVRMPESTWIWMMSFRDLRENISATRSLLGDAVRHLDAATPPNQTVTPSRSVLSWTPAAAQRQQGPSRMPAGGQRQHLY